MSKTLIDSLTDNSIQNVNKIILDQINTPVTLLNRACAHLIVAGGKRIRPRLLLLISELLAKDGSQNPDLQKLAASLEIIHTATLLHDDVIDQSSRRRGMESTNEKFGNTIAVLAGDFLFTQAFNLTNSANNKINSLLVNCLATLVKGEVEQLSNIADTFLTKESYFNVIYAKTSILFEVASKIPGHFFNLSDDKILALETFGQAIGNAFQIQDDILDYVSDSKVLGKNIGDDLQEEKITLPLIFVFEKLAQERKHELEEAIKKHDIDVVLKLINETDAINECIRCANEEVNKAINALACFEDNLAKEALIELAKLTVTRKN